jgi:hypothetical protein
MLRSAEREFLNRFIGYHYRVLIGICTESGCKADTITKKINEHKTELGKFKAKPLTNKEYSAISRLLYDVRSDYFAWCKTYNLDQKMIDKSLKTMIIQSKKVTC